MKQILRDQNYADNSVMVPVHYLHPNGTDALSANRRLLKKEILYSFSTDTVPLPPFLLCFFFLSVCSFPSCPKNHVPDDFEIHQLLGIVI